MRLGPIDAPELDIDLNEDIETDFSCINPNQIEDRGRIMLRIDEVKKRKEERTGEKITWQRVSNDTGISYTTVLRYAKNHVDRYDSTVMGKLGEYFDASLEEMVGYEK